MKFDSFNSIVIRRPKLAQAYLALLRSQPERPLALFAPRRIGKTVFLADDVTPEAKAQGFLPIYCDLWLNSAIPLESINHALEEAWDDLTVPASESGKVAKTKVKKVSIMGSGVDLGEEPQRRALPDIPAFRLDSLLGRLSNQHKGPVLLLLDEAQSLGAHSKAVEIISSLRAALTKHKGRVFAIFTGSSQIELSKMFSTAGAPMYQYAQKLDFPVLGDDFSQALADHFSSVHPGKAIPLDALRMMFVKMGYKPAVLREIVVKMSSEGSTDVHRGLDLFLKDPLNKDSWDSLLDKLDLIDILLLIAITKGEKPYGKEVATALEGVLKDRPTPSKVRSSIDKLIRDKLLSKRSEGVAINDEAFAEYLLQTELATLTRGAISVGNEGIGDNQSELQNARNDQFRDRG